MNYRTQIIQLRETQPHLSVLEISKLVGCSPTSVGVHLRYKTDEELRLFFRNRARKQRYKLSEIEYKTLLTEQKGVCAICEGLSTGKRKTLFVDHCHVTQKIRGLLCADCNHALGLFKENSSLVFKAAEYMKKWEG